MESEIFGRDSERDEIVNTLLDPQREEDKISVLSIVGMGGLGKTTLTQLVYNNERVQQHFQLLMWVCVSTEFDITNIIKSIIQVAQKGVDVDTSNKEVLQKQLRELLDKKRYLLVLDDVWNEQREKWDELKTLLFSGRSSGNMIVVTTRSKKVASIMGTMPSNDLKSLTKEDAWRLFEKRVVGAWVKKPSEELVEVCRTIVNKCAGLPLAVKAMGGLMESNLDVRDWHVVAENKIWEGLVSSESILPLLKLSYDHLPSYMQQCFAFCAVFPQDYSINMDTLIQLWMANDFIPNDGTIDLEDKGRYIFNELCWRSFFQDIRKEDTDLGSIVTCKMHDLMHNLATRVAGKKCSTQLKLDNLGIDQTNVQHLFICEDKSFNIHVMKQFPIINTLLVFDPPDCHTQRHSYSLKSSSLRALKFQLDDTPPKELGYMKHLRYLDLSYGRFHILPESTSKLYNLQTLKLSKSKIRELPEGMRYMTNLRHVFLDDCDDLERMPIGLGKLQFLRTLTKYVVVDHERGGRIEELRNFNLYGHLMLSGLGNVKNRGDAEAVNLVAKSNLKFLELVWYSTVTTRNDQAILDALIPHNELEVLKIDGYNGSIFPKWMKEHCIKRTLKSLQLEACNNCSELPPVWELLLLENLNLGNMKSLTSIVGGSCKNADGGDLLVTFSSLKDLRLFNLPNLKNWYESDPEL